MVLVITRFTILDYWENPSATEMVSGAAPDETGPLYLRLLEDTKTYSIELDNVKLPLIQKSLI